MPNENKHSQIRKIIREIVRKNPELQHEINALWENNPLPIIETEKDCCMEFALKVLKEINYEGSWENALDKTVGVHKTPRKWRETIWDSYKKNTVCEEESDKNAHPQWNVYWYCCAEFTQKMLHEIGYKGYYIDAMNKALGSYDIPDEWTEEECSQP